MAEREGHSSALQDRVQAEAQRIEEDALYSSRSQFEAARRWSRVHLWIGIPTTVLAALASGSAFNGQGLAAGIMAGLVAALSALSTFLNPSERAQSHHTAGSQYAALRNQARIFYKIAAAAMNEDDAAARVAELGTERDNLNLASPGIPRWAFERARKNIEAGEASYSVDRIR
jgi:hypothetical protein